jgi:hypothetical protein
MVEALHPASLSSDIENEFVKMTEVRNGAVGS